MTKLKINATLSVTGVLTVSDVTGYVSATIPNGFIQESTGTIPTDSYKISNGYFVDVVIFNRYNKAPVIVNLDSLVFKKILVGDVQPTYTANFPPNNYVLDRDGVYTVERYFIISKEFYDLHKATSRFLGKTIVYLEIVDGDPVLHTVVGSTDTVYTINELVEDSLTNFTGTSVKAKIIATTRLNQCYMKYTEALFNSKLTSCKVSPEDQRGSDILFLGLEVIQYLKELKNLNEIQKIIETLSACNGLCASVYKASGCGCS